MVVTGVSAGLGIETARALAAHGACRHGLRPGQSGSDDSRVRWPLLPRMGRV
jgi:NAD(P)-dependent dehydrogenase (short-subunit alcohol dehydrogenase family)